MIYDERTQRSAAFVSKDKYVERLERLPFKDNDINEEWLQELLESYPEIIPSAEFSKDFTPLVCIGREVPVGSGNTAGYIDNLYVTPSGHVVIVETKLFRNQESRRTVVAQIVDYAKELQRWNAEQLDKWAQTYFEKADGHAYHLIDKLIQLGYENFDEAAFIDNLNYNLKNASFLLLIIGDGIRSNVEELADFMNQNMNLKFQLGLVAMELYRHGDGIIAIPNILTKTKIVERNYYSFDHPEIPYVVPDSVEKPKYIRKPVPTREEFIAKVAEMGGFDHGALTGFIETVETADGIYIEMFPSELAFRFTTQTGKVCSIFVLTISYGEKHPTIYLCPDNIYRALNASDIPRDRFDAFLEFYKPYIDTNRCKHVPYEFERGFYFADLNKVLPDGQQFVTAIEQFTSAIAAEDEKYTP